MTTTKPDPRKYPGRWVKATRKNSTGSAGRYLGLCIPIADNAKYVKWYLRELQMQQDAKANPDEFQ